MTTKPRMEVYSPFLAVLTERSNIKRRTMERRKKEYLAQKAA